MDKLKFPASFILQNSEGSESSTSGSTESAPFGKLDVDADLASSVATFPSRARPSASAGTSAVDQFPSEEDDHSAAQAILHFHHRASLTLKKRDSVEESALDVTLESSGPEFPLQSILPGNFSSPIFPRFETDSSGKRALRSIAPAPVVYAPAPGPSITSAVSATSGLTEEMSMARAIAGRVNHSYTDCAFLPPSEISSYRPRRGGAAVPFPLRLHIVLSGETDHTLIISWRSHGRAFLVTDPRNFVQKCLGKFFRQSKMTSFQRQLNLYGFRRITKGPDARSYYHEMFLRGRPELATAMQRLKVKGNGVKGAANPNDEPNFYLMPFVGVPDDTARSGGSEKPKNTKKTGAKGRGGNRGKATPSSAPDSTVPSHQIAGESLRDYDVTPCTKSSKKRRSVSNTMVGVETVATAATAMPSSNTDLSSFNRSTKGSGHDGKVYNSNSECFTRDNMIDVTEALSSYSADQGCGSAQAQSRRLSLEDLIQKGQAGHERQLLSACAQASLKNAMVEKFRSTVGLSGVARNSQATHENIISSLLSHQDSMFNRSQQSNQQQHQPQTPQHSQSKQKISHLQPQLSLTSSTMPLTSTRDCKNLHTLASQLLMDNSSQGTYRNLSASSNNGNNSFLGSSSLQNPSQQPFNTLGGTPSTASFDPISGISNRKRSIVSALDVSNGRGVDSNNLGACVDGASEIGCRNESLAGNRRLSVRLSMNSLEGNVDLPFFISLGVDAGYLEMMEQNRANGTIASRRGSLCTNNEAQDATRRK